MTETEKLPAGQAIERIIGLLDEAERLRITTNHEAMNAAALGEPADWSKAQSVQRRVADLKYQFSAAAGPFIILAESYGIDASPLDDFIRTGSDDLVSSAIRVLRQVQGHVLKLELEADVSGSSDDDSNESGGCGAVNAVPTSATDLARKHGLNTEALRKRLDRERGKSGDCYVEMDDAERKPRENKYLYRPDKVQHIIDDMKRTKSSGERPAR